MFFKRLYAIIFVVPLILVFSVDAPAAGKSGARSVNGKVVQVLSGDSLRIKIADKVEEVRYIGVRAPRVKDASETGPDHNRRAFLLNTELVGGKIVHLEFDVLPRDPAGRLLAYVFLLNGAFINAELLLGGHCVAAYTPPNGMYKMLFARLERQAASVGRGLWRERGADPIPWKWDGFRGPYVANRKYNIFHRPGCPWIKGIPSSEALHFKNRDDALSNGCLPCLHCNP